MSDEEKVVSWFEENYKSLIFGVVIGLTLLFGYKSYLSSQNSAQLELSRQFDLAVTSYQNGSTTDILSFSKLQPLFFPNFERCNAILAKFDSMKNYVALR